MEIPRETAQTPVVVLLSGGVDSAACVAFYLSQGFKVQGLHVNYGQLAAQMEHKAALTISNYYNIPTEVHRMAKSKILHHGEIKGRNAFLILTALMKSGLDTGLIATGIHSGSRYFDCSASFAALMQKLLDGYTGGKIKIGNPFLAWTKSEIWKFCKDSKVPIQFTYSCEKGKLQPCGACLSCKDYEALHEK